MEKKCNFWSSDSIAQQVFLNDVSLCNVRFASQKAPFEQGSIKNVHGSKPGVCGDLYLFQQHAKGIIVDKN